MRSPSPGRDRACWRSTWRPRSGSIRRRARRPACPALCALLAPLGCVGHSEKSSEALDTGGHPSRERAGKPRKRTAAKAGRCRSDEQASDSIRPRRSAAQGRERRSVITRTELGEWSALTDRTDPVSLLEEGAKSRVPELARSATGACYLRVHVLPRNRGDHGADLASTHPSTGMVTQLCADAHLSTGRSQPTARSSSTATTSTRPPADPGSGTSSASPRASRSPDAKT